MAGYWSGFPFWQTTLLCIAGGILGVIFTIPLRYAMVVKSDLPYPEGVAAAEILKVGGHEEGDNRQGGSGIKELAAGGALAGLMSFCAGGLRVIADSASYWFKSGTAIFQLPMGFSLALLGAGYLVGLTGGIAILLGISIAWGIAVPYFSSHIPQPSDMEMAAFAMKLWKEKVWRRCARCGTRRTGLAVSPSCWAFRLLGALPCRISPHTFRNLPIWKWRRLR